MATDKVQLWNMALGHIKSNKFVTSDTEAGFVGDNCRLYYNTARMFLLEANDWNFARQDAVLALTANTPTEFEFEYVMPSDAATARRIYNPLDPHGNTMEPIKFKTAKHPTSGGKVVRTDMAEAILFYTANIVDTTLFSGSFDLCLSFYLASVLAIPITGDEKKAEKALASYRLQIGQAIRQNDLESFAQEDRPASWIAARA